MPPWAGGGRGRPGEAGGGRGMRGSCLGAEGSTELHGAGGGT